jgi:tripeptidyl-peptidase-1
MSLKAYLLSLLIAACEARSALKQVDSVHKSVLSARGWTNTQRVNSDQKINLEIALTFQNTDKLISQLLDVSDPKSGNYGKWLKKETVDSLVQPSAEANNQVLKWLQDEGVTITNSDGTWIKFQTNIETANKLLAADFQHFERDGVGKIRTTSYSVPEHLLEHIDLIHPTTFFGHTEAFMPHHIPIASEKRQTPPAKPAPPPATPESPDALGCHEMITPACLKEMYNIGSYTPLATSGSKVGFSSFLNQSYIYKDLATFQKTFKVPLQNATKININGAVNDQSPEDAQKAAGEANLDAQNILGIAHGLPIFEFLTGGSPPFIPDLEMPTAADNQNEPYLPYYQYLLSLDDSQVPAVISNSYGEPEQTVPQNYAQRICTMVAQLTARGVTIFESSGDVGVGSYCAKNDGSGNGTFLPQFPSTCPWITSVGGTQAYGPEIAWLDSSGGFSNYWERPKYQQDAVATVSTK